VKARLDSLANTLQGFDIVPTYDLATLIDGGGTQIYGVKPAIGSSRAASVPRVPLPLRSALVYSS